MAGASAMPVLRNPSCPKLFVRHLHIFLRSSISGHTLFGLFFPKDLENACLDLWELQFWAVRRYAEIPDFFGMRIVSTCGEQN